MKNISRDGSRTLSGREPRCRRGHAYEAYISDKKTRWYALRCRRCGMRKSITGMRPSLAMNAKARKRIARALDGIVFPPEQQKYLRALTERQYRNAASRERRRKVPSKQLFALDDAPKIEEDEKAPAPVVTTEKRTEMPDYKVLVIPSTTTLQQLKQLPQLQLPTGWQLRVGSTGLTVPATPPSRSTWWTLGNKDGSPAKLKKGEVPEQLWTREPVATPVDDDDAVVEVPPPSPKQSDDIPSIDDMLADIDMALTATRRDPDVFKPDSPEKPDATTPLFSAAAESESECMPPSPSLPFDSNSLFI